MVPCRPFIIWLGISRALLPGSSIVSEGSGHAHSFTRRVRKSCLRFVLDPPSVWEWLWTYTKVPHPTKIQIYTRGLVVQIPPFPKDFSPPENMCPASTRVVFFPYSALLSSRQQTSRSAWRILGTILMQPAALTTEVSQRVLRRQLV